jgi:hypothetical protein
MNGLNISLAGAVLLLAAPSAMGASIESRERAAKKACLLGDVDKGAEILADLYVETNDVGYIYNSARCFEQNGKAAQSALHFREYLRKAKNLSQADTDAVLKRIDELQGADGKHSAQPAPAPLPAQAVSAMPLAAAVTTPPDPLGISQSAPPPEPQESRPVYKRWWFWTGIGAVVAGGVVTGVLLSKKSPATRSTCDAGVACAP